MATTTLQPQEIALNVVYEDQDIIVINKPVGLVVHPGAGCADSTLLNALLYHYPELSNIPRAGIIHRLDKDTSGLLVITRNLISHTKLVSDLQKRQIKREYVAIVNGVVTTGGTIKAPIGRHPTKRTLMAVKEGGRPSTTHYRVLERFSAHTYLKVILETGRTHQIRVHLTHIGYPIVGDPTYGKRIRMPKKCSDTLRKTLENFKHQALHAQRLELKHPSAGKTMEWEVEPPEDMKKLLQAFL
jgi:23S rRNA pseudouridine1911/1915/1917 synthase